MGLNIKNEETHRLVRRLAELTGQSQTSAVEDAVRRRLAELTREDDIARSFANIMEISRQSSAAMSDEVKQLDINDLLYDELGMPT
jgi:antitoxin VapB